MTVFLWYSEKMIAQGQNAADIAGENNDRCYTYHLTEDNTVVMTSCIGERMSDKPKYDDTVLVGRADHNICLVNIYGTLTPAGRQYCDQQGLPPLTASIAARAVNGDASVRENARAELAITAKKAKPRRNL